MGRAPTLLYGREGAMKILFRIPLTWYFLAITNGVQVESVSDHKKKLLCLVTKQWDVKGGFYYYKIVN